MLPINTYPLALQAKNLRDPFLLSLLALNGSCYQKDLPNSDLLVPRTPHLSPGLLIPM